MRLRLLLPVLAIAVSVPRAAAAQSPRDTARALVRQGNQLLAKRACKKALQKFQKAKEIYPTSYKVHVNLGTTLECLGLLPKAGEHFERFLGRANASADKKMMEAVQEKLSRLRKKVASITVKDEGQEAEIELDGRLLDESDLGHRIYLPPGTHRLRASKPGHAPFVWQRTMLAGEHREVELRWTAPTPSAGPVGTPPPDTKLSTDLVAEDGHSGQPEEFVQASGDQEDTPGPSPFYKKWWFWTAVGGVVVGAVVAGVVASQTGGSDRLPVGEAGSITLE